MSCLSLSCPVVLVESKVSDVRVRHECEMCSTAVSAAVAMIMALATVGGVGLEAVVQAALELAMKHTHRTSCLDR